MQDECNDDAQMARDAARRALNSNIENFELQVEQVRLNSKLLFARYESLVEAGFEKTEAYQLILHRGLY